MSNLKLGSTAPDFSAESTEGPIQFHEWLGNSWGILFSHPADFTPVCTTELGVVAQLKNEFKLRRTKVIAISVDDLQSHKKWIKDINHTQQTKVDFPLIADPNGRISTLYEMIHPEQNDRQTVRSVFVIDPYKKIRLIITYPASTGRNFQEILRVLDSLQLTEYEKVATPANWELGDHVVILPSISNEEANEKFPQGFKEVTPYLRYTTVLSNNH